MVKLNINELEDNDLVIYEDYDVEFKHNTNGVHSLPVLLADKRLPTGVCLKQFTHILSLSDKEIRCFVVKTTDEDFNYWNDMPKCRAYGSNVITQ